MVVLYGLIIKCPTCTKDGVKSTVYPLRFTDDPYYDPNGRWAMRQLDVFWDSEGLSHSHVIMICSKQHEWRHNCESCKWADPVPAPPPAVGIAAPPLPMFVPPPPPSPPVPR